MAIVDVINFGDKLAQTASSLLPSHRDMTEQADPNDDALHYIQSRERRYLARMPIGGVEGRAFGTDVITGPRQLRAVLGSNGRSNDANSVTRR
jgi:hypothetical protein